MTDEHTHAEQPHPTDKLYLAIAGTLGVLTVFSYLADLIDLPKLVLVLVVLAVAVVKAALVASYFMHLKFDWFKVRILIIPAVILSAVLVFALFPDIKNAIREAAGKIPPATSATGGPPSAPAGHGS